eukprot:3216160-Prymnesium_polylepis.1
MANVLSRPRSFCSFATPQPTRACHQTHSIPVGCSRQILFLRTRASRLTPHASGLRSQSVTLTAGWRPLPLLPCSVLAPRRLDIGTSVKARGEYDNTKTK